MVWGSWFKIYGTYGFMFRFETFKILGFRVFLGRRLEL